MRGLKSLFLYRERDYSQADKSFPSIHDNMYFLSKEVAGDVSKYMKSGLVILEFVSPVSDPVKSGDMVRNAIFSDGVYAWDGIVINWVEKYRVRLPDEFMRHFEMAKDHDLPVSEQDAERLFDEFRSASKIYL